MKRLITLFVISMLIGSAFGQVPQKLSYEAIVRDSAFVALDSVQVGIQLSLVSDTTSGTPVYFETHTATTGSSGLVQLQIGTGTTIDTFSAINWADGPYYLMTKIDPAGGTNYSINGVTKMLAVPYAHVSVSATKADTAGRAAGLNFRVSYEGDSLLLGNGDFLILPGLSESNPPPPITGCELDETAVVEVNSATGKVWMDRNLGALRAAVRSDDSLAYGALYQWGRSADGHQCRNSDTTSTLASTATAASMKFIVNSLDPADWLTTQDDSLWHGVDGVNNPCPTGFRIPTRSEWAEEIDSWGSEDIMGAFNSPLKLPVTGYRNGQDGKFREVGTEGHYWPSSVAGSNAFHQRFQDSSADLSVKNRVRGHAVRCLKDQP